MDIVKQHEGADPAAVVFDATSAAKARRSDVVLVDTAGRLHNKQNLMNELNKIEEFHKSFEENGMKPEEFVTYGGFRDTLTTFIAGYDDLCKLIRGYMI